METLYELARINKRFKKVSDSIIPSDEHSSLRKLYEIVFSKEELDDESAMLEVYGKRNLVAFSRLKSRLKDYLIRATILQNSGMETADSRVNEALNGYRHTLVSRVLIAKKAKNLGIELAEKSIAKSMKYHATENVLLQCKMLVNNYGGSDYNKYKYNKFLAIQEKYLNIYSWELKAEQYFLDLQRTQMQSLANASPITIEKARKYCEELEKVNIRSYFFSLTKYKVQAAYYEYVKDYDAILAISEKAIREFNAPDFKSGNALFSINLRKAWALIQAGRNLDAIKMGTKEMARLPQGSLGWYLMGHYTLKAYLYNEDYISAIKLLTHLIQHPQYPKLSENYKELFNTTHGYLKLILESKYFASLKEETVELPDFKIYKYLNEVPVFTKDKRGINVSILLMHIAYLLLRKDHDTIIDRVDSLNQYAYRYLRKDDSFRSNCMIKMVIQMTKADFNPIRTERYTSDLLRQLKEVNLAGSGENIETEIIPHEVLWMMMMHSLAPATKGQPGTVAAAGA